MSYSSMMCCCTTVCCCLFLIALVITLLIVFYNQLYHYKVNFEFGYTEDMEDLDFDDVEERLPFLKEQWNKNYWISDFEAARVDELVSFVNKTYEDWDE